MKKIILLALVVLMMTGCVNLEAEKDSNGHIAISKNNHSINPYISIIDSCEYIGWGYGHAHKGNCRFCEERDSIKWEKRKKEFKELIIKLLKEYDQKSFSLVY